MKSDILFYLELALSFLPFVFFAFLNSKVNVRKAVRSRQYIMPVLAIVYSTAMLVFMKRISEFMMPQFLKLAPVFDELGLGTLGNLVRNLYSGWQTYLLLVFFNTFALLAFVVVKRFVTLIIGKIPVPRNSFVGDVVELFYNYDETDGQWYIKKHYGQATTFIKTAYYGSCFASGLALLISCYLCMKHLIVVPFYPVFAVIIIGEMAFFIDGKESEEQQSELNVEADNARHNALYPLLRKPLRELFGDKLSAEGTTVNEGGTGIGSIEDILFDLEKNGKHIGENYAAFIRKKMESGLKPNADYLRCGFDLATGKSLLFNTPFYDKLNPYIFYAMNRELLKGGKVLIVLGRHGTEDDLYRWCENGIKEVTNISDVWKISVLSSKKCNDEDLPDIGIISCSGVHDLDIHKNNLTFLKNVSFVMIVEPSRLVATAQIGLKLLIKCCGEENEITFCSIDRNCDGLVDSLSHILMTNITEVSATEYPHGISSYMCWNADSDYIQHRILPGVSRYLGIGTELSMVALRNQVKNAVWYGGDAYPVLDAHWIAKQYYYDLLDYANLPANQETFEKCFRTSFNMCNKRMDNYSFVTVEDDRNNLFETRRNFATIAENQGFVNVISSEYMLREYMSDNPELFTADAKAVPYITADYARTKRNDILSICLLLCVDSVIEKALERQMVMMNIDTKDPASEIWKELCVIFGNESQNEFDKNGNPVLSVKNSEGKTISFKKDETIIFKREYSINTGKFESVYRIENSDFAHLILDDLQNAVYIAEQESKDIYIGTELKGHVYQKYLPGQFFTLNGKYYEMIATAADDRILVRRASEHIGGRLSYRQIRNYRINHIEDSSAMGAIKTINDIDIRYQFADFSVETPGYWKLGAYNDFENGKLVKVNGVPVREYHHKQILKLDFSRFGDAFTDSVRMTLTNLLNEVFVTLFAENQPFISAVTAGNYEAPLTYSLSYGEKAKPSDKCIYIIEDSQLDIGLLVAMERNFNRIFQIITDYLEWNNEEIEESIREQNEPEEKKEPEVFNPYEERKTEKKKGFFARIIAWFKKVFSKKKKEPSSGKEVNETENVAEEENEKPEEMNSREISEEKNELQEISVEEELPATGESSDANETAEEHPEAVAEKPLSEMSAKERRKAAKLEKKRRNKEKNLSGQKDSKETETVPELSEETGNKQEESKNEAEVNENE